MRSCREWEWVCFRNRPSVIPRREFYSVGDVYFFFSMSTFRPVSVWYSNLFACNEKYDFRKMSCIIKRKLNKDFAEKEELWYNLVSIQNAISDKKPGKASSYTNFNKVIYDRSMFVKNRNQRWWLTLIERILGSRTLAAVMVACRVTSSI